MPDFLVIGAPKAGTTALHAALSEHPGLYMSAIKEPKFFLSDGPPPTKGGPGDALTYREHVWRRADYEALFAPAPPGTLRGESTPLYLYDRAAMGRIRDTLPQARLIVIVRDPVERAHSNWAHLWSAGLEPVADFVRACGEEERRIAAGWASFWHYTGLGRYGEQLQYLFTLFPREQVLVLRYRQLVDEPAQALDRICAFLGVQTGVLTHLPRHNVTSHPEPTLAHRAVSAGPAGGQRGRQPGPRPDRGHPDRPARAVPPAAQPGAAAAGLGAAPGTPSRASSPTSRCSSRSSARTSATGCGRGSAPAAWSAPGPPGRARPEWPHRRPGARQRSSVTRAWDPSGPVSS